MKVALATAKLGIMADAAGDHRHELLRRQSQSECLHCRMMATLTLWSKDQVEKADEDGPKVDPRAVVIQVLHVLSDFIEASPTWAQEELKELAHRSLDQVLELVSVKRKRQTKDIAERMGTETEKLGSVVEAFINAMRGRKPPKT